MNEKNVKRGGMLEMILIALPMVVSHACDTVMIFTDRLFLSKLGAMQMTASMAGGMSSFMLMSFFLGLTGYSTAIVAQFFGSKQHHKCALVAAQSLIVAICAFPLILSCRPLIFWLFEHLGLDAKQLVYQKIYFSIIIFSVVITLIRSSISGFFCGIGRTRIVMLSALIAMVSNIIFNYVLIFGKLGFPALGIRGAAFGTILGAFLGLCFLCFSYFNKQNAVEFHTRKNLCFDAEIMKKLWRFGSPSGIELLLNFSAFTGMMFLFHSQGPVAATASTIMINWDMVSFVPLLGVEIGVTSLVGRYMGLRQPDIAHRSTMSGLKCGCSYSAIIFVLFVLFPAQLVSWFRPHDVSAIYLQAEPIAVFMLRVACLYVFLEAVIVTFIGALRGAGDTLWAMCLTVGLHIYIVIIQFICLKIWKVSIEITWVFIVISFFIGSTLIVLRYKKGQWRLIQMIDHPPEIIQTDGFHEL